MVSIEVSVGELFDKITILKIKQKKLTDKEQLANVNKELEYLEDKAFTNDPEVNVLVEQLQEINEQLWDIENGKRKCEADKSFGSKFVELARDVYIKNDDRATIKKLINVITKSSIVEEKDYTRYDT
jgi:hypothetical protein|tara:strand:+ start:281 stop:661 length:381 start_codon:yes stop_codon:yes gene_type:complete